MNSRLTPQELLRAILTWFIVLSAGLLLFLLFMSKQLDAITDLDALDYAQVARNVAEGQGYSTDFVRPLSLAQIPQIDHHPEMTFMPLHPLFMAAIISVVGATKQAVALASALPFLATLILIYLLGLRYFDRRVAILSVLLLATNIWVLRFAISGLEGPLLGFLFTAMLLVLHVAEGSRRQVWWMIPAGVLLGLLTLTKEVWGLALIPTVFYVWLSAERRRRLPCLGLFLVAFVLVLAPWAVRMAHLTGNPLFTWRWYESVMETQTNPANTLYRSYQAGLQSPLQMIILHPKEMLVKVLSGFGSLYPALPIAIGPYVAAFFIVAIVVPLGDARFERMRYLVYACYLLIFLLLVIILPAPRLLFPVVPIASLIAAACFLRILGPLVRKLREPIQQRGLVWAMVILVLVQAIPVTLDLFHPEEILPTLNLSQIEALSKAVADATTGPIVTDVPWWIAWYADRTAIWVPRSWDHMDRMGQDIGQVRFLLLTPWIAQWAERERAAEWAQMWSAALSGEPVQSHGFVVYRIYPNRWVLFVRSPQATPASIPSGTPPPSTEP